LIATLQKAEVEAHTLGLMKEEKEAASGLANTAGHSARWGLQPTLR
jgi:hypothetical protein